jgi:hypothetical protein
MTQFEPLTPQTFPGEIRPPQAGGCGCWVWGCLGVSALFLVLVGGVGFSAFWFAKGKLEAFTDTTPQKFPAIELSEEDVSALKERLHKFSQDLKEDEPTEDLFLTADELNALISSNPDMRGRVFVRIEDDRIGGDISIPTDVLPFGMGTGRFFNASAEFDVSMENGVLIVTLADAKVQGQSLPKEFLDGLRKENIVRDIYKDPKNAEVLRRIEKVTIQDGKVILRVRPPPELDLKVGTP